MKEKITAKQLPKKVTRKTDAKVHVLNNDIIVTEHLDWMIGATNRYIQTLYLGGFMQIIAGVTRSDNNSVQSDKIYFVLDSLVVVTINTPTLREYIFRCNEAGWHVNLIQVQERGVVKSLEIELC